MNLAQLRAFHAVASHGTFSAAATSLGITQSAVTQHIRALEELLGARLFHRRSSGVELTGDACDLLPTVKQIVFSLQDIGIRIDKGRDLRQGHLSLGLCSPHVAMPVVKGFRSAHPGIRIDMRLDNSATLLDLVEQYRVDVAIVTLAAPRTDLFCERLIEQEVLILVPVGHVWAKRDSVAVAELAGQAFVIREPGSMTRQLFEQALAAKSVALGPTLEIGSREALKEAVVAQLGLGIVLDRELGADVRLKGLRISDSRIRAGEYVVAQPELSELGMLRSFIAAARATFGEGAPDMIELEDRPGAMEVQ